MNKLITLLVLSLFVFGCSDSDDDKGQTDKLLGVWKNTEEKTPTYTGFGDTYIKIESFATAGKTHRIYSGYDSSLGWKGNITGRVPEEGKIYVGLTGDNALFSYAISGDVLAVKFIEDTATPMTLSPEEKEKTFKYKRTTEIN